MNSRAIRWLGQAAVATILLSAVAFAGEAGKDEKKGFFIKEGDFTLESEFWVQGKADYLKTNIDFKGDLWQAIGATSTEIDPKWDTTVRRARAVFGGTAFKPWLHWKLEADFGDGDAVLKDAYIATMLKEGMNFKFGQFRAPFDIFQLFSERDQTFVENPLGTDEFSPGRDLGAAYFGSASDKRFNWMVAVQNGDGENVNGNSDDGLLMSARFEFQNSGGFDYKATAVDRPTALQWTAGLAFTRNSSGPLVGDENSSCEPGVDKKCSYDTTSRSAVELFGALRGSRWQANATFQKWTIGDGRFTPSGDLDDLGITDWNVDFGYFVCDGWELAARYGQIKYDDPLAFFDPIFPFLPPIVSDRTDEEWRIGVNRYFLNNNLKLQVDFGQDGFKFKDQFDDDGDVLKGVNEGTSKGLRAMLSFFI